LYNVQIKIGAGRASYSRSGALAAINQRFPET